MAKLKTIPKPNAIKKATSSLKAADFVKKLKNLQSAAEQKKIERYFKTGEGQYAGNTKFIGVPMGKIFALAKEFIAMPLKEIITLLKDPVHEARVGAVSIMDFMARDKKITEERKKELFDLYIKQHKYINNWDLVDRSAPYVVGGYLFNKPRTILYKLAKSKNIWERRTSIVATYFFIRQNDTKDTFKIAGLLVKDKEDLIHKAVGGWIREAGKKDIKQLFDFLNKHAAIMPRTMLRYAIEKLDAKQKKFYMELRTANKK